MTRSAAVPNYANPRRMLLVTDLSDLSYSLPFVVRMALIAGSQVKLLYIARRSAADSSAAQRLEDASATLRQQQVECEWGLVPGKLPKDLWDELNAWKPDRIFVAPQKPHHSKRAMLDPITESLLIESSVPVFLLRPSILEATQKERSKFLFATTLDREARSVAEYMVCAAASFNSDFEMLHVISPLPDGHPLRARVRAYAECHFKSVLAGIDSSSIRCLVREGEVAETICRVADEERIDMILIGSVSGTSFRNDFMPGNAYGVVCNASCSVLVLKRPDKYSYSSIAREAEIVEQAAVHSTSL